MSTPDRSPLRLRIATDRTCWRDDTPLAPMLRPLLGDADLADDATSWDRRFEPYGRVADSLYEITSLDDADVVVVPGDWYWVRGTSWRSRPDRDLAARVRPLVERAHDAGTPVVVFFTGDRSCDRLPFDGVHVFREGAYASSLGPHDHPLPAFPEDLLAHHRDATIVERTWAARPTVGFCGLARSKPWWRRALGVAAYHVVVGARERRLDPSPYLGEVLRSEAIALLDEHPGIETNFVLRDSKVFFRDADTRDLVDVREEYVDNMVDSDYILCVRGSGNYSYRLYESMAMGRIPVIVDTDLALPDTGAESWRELAVWVDQRDLSQLPERIQSFHSQLSAQDFVELQHTLRRVWLERFSPEAFFTWLRWNAAALSAT